jgi:hypothetical protein
MVSFSGSLGFSRLAPGAFIHTIELDRNFRTFDVVIDEGVARCPSHGANFEGIGCPEF